MLHHEEINCFLAEHLFNRPGKWVDRICINTHWIEVKTWINFDEDPAHPGAGASAGMRPTRYTYPENTLRVIDKMRDKGWSCGIRVDQDNCQIGFCRSGQELLLSEYPSLAKGVAFAAEYALRNDG